MSLLWRHIENKIKKQTFKASIDGDGADEADLRYLSRVYVECEYETNSSQKLRMKHTSS